jgi:hypothetical protein
MRRCSYYVCVRTGPARLLFLVVVVRDKVFLRKKVGNSLSLTLTSQFLGALISYLYLPFSEYLHQRDRLPGYKSKSHFLFDRRGEGRL